MHIKYAAYTSNTQNWPAVDEDRPLKYLWTPAKEIWRTYQEDLFRGAYPEQTRPMEELISSVFIRNAHSRYQLREFMTDFWLNHFNVSYLKGLEVIYTLIPYDRDAIRPYALGMFRQLIHGVAISGAMLKYLDNADSNAVYPNENYARELIELHTLGRAVYYGKNTEGHDYSQVGFTDDDVIQAARAVGLDDQPGAAHPGRRHRR